MTNGDTERATPEIFMDRMPLAPRPCAIAATMELIGDRWSMLVIRELSYGGVHRFDRIAGYIGVSRDILTARLRKLEEVGVIERRQYSEHPPPFRVPPHPGRRGPATTAALAVPMGGQQVGRRRGAVGARARMRALTGAGTPLRSLRRDRREHVCRNAFPHTTAGVLTSPHGAIQDA